MHLYSSYIFIQTRCLYNSSYLFPQYMSQLLKKKLSLCMRKPTICMGENKDADQLRGNREADQRLCFRYTDSTFPPLLIPKFSRFWVSSVTVQAGLCWTWSETQIVGFVMHRFIFYQNSMSVQQFLLIPSIHVSTSACA